MHTYFITRGIIQDVEMFTKFLETRMMQLPFKAPDGKIGIQGIQGALRPIQLWEYVHPANAKDIVWNTLRVDHELPYMKAAKMKLAVASMRKMLGAKKFPDYDKSNAFAMPNKLWVDIIPIGFKKDKMDFKTPDGVVHEGV